MKKQYKKGQAVQLTPHFSTKEFDCRCSNSSCQWTIIDTDHVSRLEEKRVKLGKVIRISSGYRCEVHNKAVGGETNSRHVAGDATDITIDGMKPNEVANEFENFDGVGRYDTFTHVDSRGSKSRWDFRKNK